MGVEEWNNFCDRINAFLEYKFGASSRVTFTRASYDMDFYATMFNEAKNAIGGMNPTGISNKVKGNDILAGDLNTLRSKLNGIT